MRDKNEMTPTSKIVVVGGGMAGYAAVVKKLEKMTDPKRIILIEPRDYVEVPFAVPRGLMDPNGFGRSIRRPIRELTSVEHVRARAREIRGNELFLENGTKISFGAAIVATGSVTKGHPFIKGGGALSESDRQVEFSAEAERIRRAGSVLLVGGGPIGVELAGEIKSSYPKKVVTIAERKDRLLPELPEPAGEKARRVLTNMGVNVLLNNACTVSSSGCVDKSGQKIDADVLISVVGIETTGIQVDGPESLNDKGQLKVDAYLRVVGRTNVFAVGDVNDVAEIKLAINARGQSGVAATNCSAVLESTHRRLRTYKPAKPVGFVTLGHKSGIYQLPMGRIDFLIAVKQKDLFVSWYLK